MPRLQPHLQNGRSYLPPSGGEMSRQGRLRTTTAVNLSIVADRPLIAKKLPLKTMSFQAPRGVSVGSSTLLPEYGENQFPSHSQHQKPSIYRASVKGRRDVLPFASPVEGYVTDSVWNRSRRSSLSGPMDNIKAITQRLRSRRRTTSTGELANQLDNNAYLSDNSSNNNHQQWSASNSYSQSSKNRKRLSIFRYLSPLPFVRKRDWLQILVICVVTFLVVDSYMKAVSTTERLERFKEDESMMMLHLQRIEQQSIHLHENLSRLGDMSGKASASDYYEPAEDSSTVEGVDSNLIRVQTQQLYQMEEELDHELRSLQAKLQHVARSSIISIYGEGPVKVELELDFPDGTAPSGSNAISILLWYDTPHAAWTWLEQIRKGEWNGSFFTINDSSIDSSPVIMNAGTLDFFEKSQKGHDAWTVGLTDHEGNLGMFINLDDNVDKRKHEVCVGKVIDGFDVLQKLVEVSRQDTRRPVNIHLASASHLTRSQRPL